MDTSDQQTERFITGAQIESQKNILVCQYGVWVYVEIESKKNILDCQYGVLVYVEYRISKNILVCQYGVRVYVEQDMGSSHLRPVSLNILSSPWGQKFFTHF